MNLTQDTLAPLIHDRDGGAQLDPILAGLVLSPQELADLATLLLTTANRIDYGGGGIDNDSSGTVTLNGGTIKNNTATYLGGGIYNGSSATVTLNGGTITNNEAESGGGIRNDGGTVNGNPNLVTGNRPNDIVG